MSYSHSFATKNDTICAVATPTGTGAIAIVRMSGPESLDIAFKLFTPFQENLKKNQVKSHHMYYGQIRSEKELVDEVLFTYFKAPHSYTGEDSVELSCHGSE
ncbi:MAG TPA: tRNA uridine-5-carboxymethylaminomethyl(34) synthesis GTPase MnmE, partial [Bacteroidetes bacterium]|nr:tRNA uridine-5-carboxymethylaminomethyl(34) synthesis GTPase MnmE [Bacteroidota bacterium]